MQVCKNGKGGVCVCSVTAMTLSPHCSSAVIPESTDPQRVKDPSNSGNTEALSDKAFQQSQQLTGTVAVSVWCMVKQLLCPFPPPPNLLFLYVWLKLVFKEIKFVLRSDNVFKLCLTSVGSQHTCFPPEL